MALSEAAGLGRRYLDQGSLLSSTVQMHLLMSGVLMFRKRQRPGRVPVDKIERAKEAISPC
eukprot:27121-Eustigmatos_ZCMA.PRE.1